MGAGFCCSLCRRHVRAITKWPAHARMQVIRSTERIAEDFLKEISVLKECRSPHVVMVRPAAPDLGGLPVSLRGGEPSCFLLLAPALSFLKQRHIHLRALMQPSHSVEASAVEGAAALLKQMCAW